MEIVFLQPSYKLVNSRSKNEGVCADCLQSLNKKWIKEYKQIEDESGQLHKF